MDFIIYSETYDLVYLRMERYINLSATLPAYCMYYVTDVFVPVERETTVTV